MYDRNKQESQTRRSQAVEKAMNMKIKKVNYEQNQACDIRQLFHNINSCCLMIPVTLIKSIYLGSLVEQKDQT